MKGKINENYLVVLNQGLTDEYLCVDFLPIAKIFEKDLKEFQSLIISDMPIKNVLRKFKRYKFLLKPYNYSVVIANSYQQLISYADYSGIRYLLGNPKVDLVNFFILRLKAYRIEKTYNKADLLIKKSKLLAYSHRVAGWAALPFDLNDKFQIRFNTNFGYGYVSYFYLVIKYKNIIIIPYSEWVLYVNVSIYEIHKYTRKYKLIDESWLEAMEDCKELYNLSISDESKFVEKYITGEALKMVERLKGLMDYKEFKLFKLNKDAITIKKDGYKIIEYRAEKISGALKFIGHLKNFSTIESISKIINEIESMNNELLPVLKHELKLVTERFNEIEPELLRLEPIIKKLKDRSNYITQIHNEIVDDLHNKYNDNFGKKSRREEIERLLSKKLPDWKVEKNDYLNGNNYGFYNLKQEKDKLKPFKEVLEKYVREMEKYFKNN